MSSRRRRTSSGYRISATRTDCAVLDKNLRAETSLALAERLLAEGVHVVFLSGDADGAMPAVLDGVTRLPKPVSFERLNEALAAPNAGATGRR